MQPHDKPWLNLDTSVLLEVSRANDAMTKDDRLTAGTRFPGNSEYFGLRAQRAPKFKFSLRETLDLTYPSDCHFTALCSTSRSATLASSWASTRSSTRPASSRSTSAPATSSSTTSPTTSSGPPTSASSPTPPSNCSSTSPSAQTSGNQ